MLKPMSNFRLVVLSYPEQSTLRVLINQHSLDASDVDEARKESDKILSRIYAREPYTGIVVNGIQPVATLLSPEEPNPQRGLPLFLRRSLVKETAAA